MWTYSKPRLMGFVTHGRKGYFAIFRQVLNGFHYEEHIVFFTNRPSTAAKTIAKSEFPAKFGHAHFDDAGQIIQLPAAIAR